LTATASPTSRCRARRGSYPKGLIGPLILFAVIQLGFSAIFVQVEELDYGIALYHCMVTATTVGYGDVAIVTDAGKMVAFCHIFCSVSMLAALLAEFDTLRTQRTRDLKRGRQFLGRLDINTILSLDTDGQGVDRFEFVVGMLTKLEYVDPQDVQGFVAQFDALDQSGDGQITRAELERYVEAQRKFAEHPERLSQVCALQRTVLKDTKQQLVKTVADPADETMSATRKKLKRTLTVPAQGLSRATTVSTINAPASAAGNRQSTEGSTKSVAFADGRRKSAASTGALCGPRSGVSFLSHPDLTSSSISDEPRLPVTDRGSCALVYADEIEAEINAAPASEDTEGARPLCPPGCLMVSRTAEGV